MKLCSSQTNTPEKTAKNPWENLQAEMAARAERATRAARAAEVAKTARDELQLRAATTSHECERRLRPTTTIATASQEHD